MTFPSYFGIKGASQYYFTIYCNPRLDIYFRSLPWPQVNTRVMSFCWCPRRIWTHSSQNPWHVWLGRQRRRSGLMDHEGIKQLRGWWKEWGSHCNYFKGLYTCKHDKSMLMADQIAAMLDLGLKIKVVDEACPLPPLNSNSARKSGPVRFFGPKKQDWDRDWSRHLLKPKKTWPGLKKTKPVVFFGLWTGLGLNLVLAGSDWFFDRVNNTI